MKARALVLAAMLGSSLAHAHDVSFDVGLSSVKPTDQNPRSGSATANLSGAYDFNEDWSAWLGATYTRDFATKTTDTSSPGSNIFLFNAGAMWLVSDHVSLLAGGTFSPKTTQLSATTVTDPSAPTRIDAVVRSDNASWGVNAAMTWGSNGLSAFESTVDASVALTSFSVFQQAELGTSVRAGLLRNACRLSASPGCALVNGSSQSLAQVRLTAGYTATIRAFDAGIDVSWFLYDRDPNQVGYFSLLELGRDLGNGVPVAPFLFTLRPAFTYRVSKLTFKLSYQLGVYTGSTGSNQLVSLKTTFAVSRSVRLALTLSGQADREGGVLVNTGGTAMLGVVFVF